MFKKSKSSIPKGMKILFVASEAAPIAKVGGLADVIGSLPKALKKIGVDISVVIPFYEVVEIEKDRLVLANKNCSIMFEGKKTPFNVWKTNLPESDVPLFLIQNNDYFQGGIYVEKDASSGGSELETSRFLFLSKAAIELAKLIKADILHCHDWHVGLIPFLIKKDKLPIKTLLTIHNLGYQGIYSNRIVNKLLDTYFIGEVNCLKEGILSADFINTVSENYAQEILMPEFGFGLEKYLKEREKNLVGILNGLDLRQFSPETDLYIERRYSVENLKDKQENKSYLQKTYFGNVDPAIPLLGMVSRLATQKGFYLIEKVFHRLMKENVQFILLGKGNKTLEGFFREKVKEYPDKFFAKIAFDEKLAHLIYAGSDIFLMPSVFEPCGLGQLIAMRYGTIPVVRAVGGLKDTVLPIEIPNLQDSNSIKGTGFLFDKYDPEEFLKAIKTALEAYKNKKIWKQIQINGMKQDFSWEKSARKYLDIYKTLIDK